MKTIVSYATVAIMAGFAQAELPAGSYDRFRKEAAEVLVIEVVTIKSTEQGKVTDYAVVAKVLAVEKTNTMLKKGDLITINYSKMKPPFDGPRQQDALVKGDVYPAFLKLSRQGQDYTPAAYGMSFSIASE